MDNRYFTVQELQALKFYELPNPIYSQILSDLVHLFGVMTSMTAQRVMSCPDVLMSR